MRKVKLRMNEQEKYDVIKRVVAHNGNKRRAAHELGITLRQVNRLINLYNEKGKVGFIHGNRSKKPKNTLDPTLSNEIILLYTFKYQPCNFNHFKDLLKKDENIIISYSFLYNLLMSYGFVSPKIQKATKRRLAEEKIKDRLPSKTEEEIDVLVNHEIALEEAHPRKERSKYFGELLQMDASHHLWFGETKAFLHLVIDDATGRLVGGYFDWQETLNAYYHVFFQILTEYGIPLAFLTDYRTVFAYYSSKLKYPEKDVLTQFGYACKILGVSLESTSVPQAKGRIERVFNTLQSRLIQELRLNGITTIEEANKYLIEVFIPDFNERFSLSISNFPTVFESSPSLEKINYTLAVLATRKIDNGNSIKYKNTYYQPFRNDELVCFKPKTECLVIRAFNGDLLVTIDEQVYELKELKRNAIVSSAFNEIAVNPIKEKKVYTPPMSHPWKAESFRRQMQKAHKEHVYA